MCQVCVIEMDVFLPYLDRRGCHNNSQRPGQVRRRHKNHHRSLLSGESTQKKASDHSSEEPFPEPLSSRRYLESLKVFIFSASANTFWVLINFDRCDVTVTYLLLLSLLFASVMSQVSNCMYCLYHKCLHSRTLLRLRLVSACLQTCRFFPRRRSQPGETQDVILICRTISSREAFHNT